MLALEKRSTESQAVSKIIGINIHHEEKPETTGHISLLSSNLPKPY